MRIFLTLLLTLLTFTAGAAVRRLPLDVKYPTQLGIEKQVFTDLVAASATRIVSATAGATSAAIASLSVFTLQPDQPRNIVITPAGTTTDIESCVITVTGKNFFNDTITEDFTFAANDTAAQTGAKAFKTITTVSFPANCESGAFAATWNIGVGEKIGLKRCMDETVDFMTSGLNGVLETRATLTADADEVEKNTADFVGTMNSSNDFSARFNQNFRCLP